MDDSFRLPALSIPIDDNGLVVYSDDVPKPDEANCLGELCEEMHAAILRKVQANMGVLQHDTDTVRLVTGSCTNIAV
jgi:hypothetical protein